MLSGLTQVVPESQLTAIVNVGDDLELHGLHISPDIDTVIYTLAGVNDQESGWGLVDETWDAMAALERYDGETWFRLGDRDLATHLYRTGRLQAGATLSTVTMEIARAWGLGLTLLPVTDDRLRTIVEVRGEGELDFQDYFVRRRHSVAVTRVRLAGGETARPAPGVLEALDESETIVIAPSNPIVSIEPLLAVRGVRERLLLRRDRVVAVSPIIAGAAVKGPADRMLAELGHEPSAVGIARLYSEIASVLVIDESDSLLSGGVEQAGLRCVVTPTLMTSPDRSATLARTVLDALS